MKKTKKPTKSAKEKAWQAGFTRRFGVCCSLDEPKFSVLEKRRKSAVKKLKWWHKDKWCRNIVAYLEAKRLKASKKRGK